MFAIEGGYVNDPNDSGGATNHGITEQVARQHGYTGPMQSLPKGMAQDIYIRSYIEQPADRVGHVARRGHQAGGRGVNAGPGRAARWFQQSLNDLSRAGRDYPPIKVDGAIGRDTLSAYAALEKRRGRVKACELTLKLLDGYQTAHYAQLAQGAANASFIVGWVDTRVQNVPLARCAESVAAATF